MRQALWLALGMLLLGVVGCGSRSSPWRPADRGGRLDGRVDVYYWLVDAREARPGPDLVPKIDGPAPSGKTCHSYCAGKADCPPPFIDCSNGRCIMCRTDADCPFDVLKGGCDVGAGLCRQCKVDADCTAAGVKIMSGKCDLPSGSCTHCDADVDCAFAGSPFNYCNTSSSTCVACKSDVDCQGKPRKSCDATSRMCIGCTSHDQCCPGKPGCGLTCELGRCLCTSAAQCLAAYGAATGKWLCY